MVCQERRIAFGSPSFFVTFGSSRFSTYFCSVFLPWIICGAFILSYRERSLQVITMEDRFEADKKM